MAVALTLFEKSQTSLGFPAREAFDGRMDGEYKVVASVDQAQRMLDLYRRDHKDLEPGTVLHVVRDIDEGDEED